MEEALDLSFDRLLMMMMMMCVLLAFSSTLSLLYSSCFYSLSLIMLVIPSSFLLPFLGLSTYILLFKYEVLFQVILNFIIYPDSFAECLGSIPQYSIPVPILTTPLPVISL